MRQKIYQIDAFTDQVYGGNPAAVCPLEDWLPDATMQSIAAENNLSETAFFVPNGDYYDLRWFTPFNEVDLCGHATLASAYVILNYLNQTLDEVVFETRDAGTLIVARDGDRLRMDFPSRPPHETTPDEALLDGLDATPAAVFASRDYLVVFDTEAEVAALQPDMTRLSQIDRFATMVTAPGDGEIDFVSRFFAPSQGVPEDPVTGSAHCTLIPYWAERLGKTELVARQISSRGGTLYCRLEGDRVSIAGHAVLYLEGWIEI